MNVIAADRYLLDSLTSQAASLRDENGVLAAEQSSIDHPKLLTEFAQSMNMVPAQDIAHIFEKDRVALESRAVR